MTLLPTSVGREVCCAEALSIAFGSDFSAVLSSSDMPFLKALMPWATSPISSEILPRPNSSRTTAITTIQCQILNEPIEKPSAPSGGPSPLDLARTYEQGAAKTRTAWPPDAADRIMAKTFKLRELRRNRLFLDALRRRRQ